MTDVTIDFRGEACTLNSRGALFLADHNTLVVSDLHFEKGTSYQRQGLTLPPYDTRTTLRNMAQVLKTYQPRRVIALGDSFHDQAARERLDESEVDTIRKLTQAHDWTWIIGNHDPVPPQDLGGHTAHSLKIGNLTFRHEPETPQEPGEVIGHFHPCAAIRARGRKVRRRCFAADTQRLILPAFGAYTGGLNVLDEAYADVLMGEICVWLLGQEGVYQIAERKLLPDPSSTINALRRAI